MNWTARQKPNLQRDINTTQFYRTRTTRLLRLQRKKQTNADTALHPDKQPLCRTTLSFLLKVTPPPNVRTPTA